MRCKVKSIIVKGIIVRTVKLNLIIWWVIIVIYRSVLYNLTVRTAELKFAIIQSMCKIDKKLLVWRSPSLKRFTE